MVLTITTFSFESLLANARELFLRVRSRTHAAIFTRVWVAGIRLCERKQNTGRMKKQNRKTHLNKDKKWKSLSFSRKHSKFTSITSGLPKVINKNKRFDIIQP